MLKSKSLQIIQYFLLLSVGLILIFLFFRNIDLQELLQIVNTGNFSWFYLVILSSIGVYVVRVLRWQMFIHANGYSAQFHNVFAALSISYFVSFVVPRLGEVTRCLSLKKKHDIPFMELLGTVITERIIDVISLFVVILLTIAFQFNQITDFFLINIFAPIYNTIVSKLVAGNVYTLIIVFLFLVSIVLAFIYFKNYFSNKTPKWVLDLFNGLKSGIISFKNIKNKKLFLFYTILIWIGYFLMTYFWFFIFEETSALTLGACLTILSVGSIGRSVPIQGGGMGAYHFLVSQVVIIYGVSESMGKTLATLIHAGQTLFTFAMGIVAFLIFFIVYWSKKNHKKAENS
ncbi:MAG: flippase-like domain-containing protein [Bacteroidia bacterium]|nr:flippase-like domain-containing protein [Bacteroidia bacterium]